LKDAGARASIAGIPGELVPAGTSAGPAHETTKGRELKSIVMKIFLIVTPASIPRRTADEF